MSVKIIATSPRGQWVNSFALSFEVSQVSDRAGASTRFTSTSTCNMCEYEYESEYLIITWVRVLVDEYKYKYEYQSMINILYRQQIFVVRSLTRESSDS